MNGDTFTKESGVLGILGGPHYLPSPSTGFSFRPKNLGSSARAPITNKPPEIRQYAPHVVSSDEGKRPAITAIHAPRGSVS